MGSRVGRDALRAMALRLHHIYVTPVWTLPPLRGGVARSVCPPTDSEVLARNDGARFWRSGAMKHTDSEGDFGGK